MALKFALCEHHRERRMYFSFDKMFAESVAKRKEQRQRIANNINTEYRRYDLRSVILGTGKEDDNDDGGGITQRIVV